jgi:hypothetical protein
MLHCLCFMQQSIIDIWLCSKTITFWTINNSDDYLYMKGKEILINIYVLRYFSNHYKWTPTNKYKIYRYNDRISPSFLRSEYENDLYKEDKSHILYLCMLFENRFLSTLYMYPYIPLDTKKGIKCPVYSARYHWFLIK